MTATSRRPTSDFVLENTSPGATSYNVKRSTVSGGETTIATVSATTNNWPASNEFTDTGLTSGTTYYYEISAVNTNGESLTFSGDQHHAANRGYQ